MSALTLRNAELNGVRTDVRIEAGRIAAMGALRGAHEIDARGGALIPGLIDHHIHLFATAARMESVDLGAARSKDDVISLLRAATAARAADIWVRAIGFDDSVAGLLSRDELDLVGAPNPIRVQDRTGALWVLNSVALERVLETPAPACVELDASGRATGRIWRGDAWLRTRMGSAAPSLAALSSQLAARGVVGVTDASVTNGAEEAQLLAAARGDGALRQSLCLMGGGELPASEQYEIGPLKILPDERDLPDVESVAAKMRLARQLGRAVAVHCVTAAELAVTLAAYEAVGARKGDRIEHGGVIPEGMIETVAALGLTVVTQPHFIFERGDRYRRTMDAQEWSDLYRLASLRRAGVAMAAGSDAPYGGLDPWRAIATAAARTTREGEVLGAEERVSAHEALALYLGGFHAPGGPARRVEVGAAPDLCLLDRPLTDALAAPSEVRVHATIARGELIYEAS
ncbi:MAG: amidohydrolase family protein [Hyphomonadaceae bacterium]|nr:amidohydrolase family protein [Hyphomonadaceae bacterium]